MGQVINWSKQFQHVFRLLSYEYPAEKLLKCSVFSFFVTIRKKKYFPVVDVAVVTTVVVVPLGVVVDFAFVSVPPFVAHTDKLRTIKFVSNNVCRQIKNNQTFKNG